MKAKTSKAALFVMISISFVLLASLGAAVHAATRAGDKYIIDENLFPDPAFRQYVLDTIDENGSGALEDFEREKVTTIDLNNGYNGSKISDLTGIEYFTSITELAVSNNALTSIDVSKLTKLVTLWINKNQLTELDLSSNNLTALYCDDNQIKSLNLAGNTNLSDLECRNNQLTSLDISMATELKLLYLENNKLEFLDLSNNSNLDMLFCSDNKLTQLDISNCTLLYGFDCSDNQLTELDVSKCNNFGILTVMGISCFHWI